MPFASFWQIHSRKAQSAKSSKRRGEDSMRLCEGLCEESLRNALAVISDEAVPNGNNVRNTKIPSKIGLRIEIIYAYIYIYIYSAMLLSIFSIYCFCRFLSKLFAIPFAYSLADPFSQSAERQELQALRRGLNEIVRRPLRRSFAKCSGRHL